MIAQIVTAQQPIIASRNSVSSGFEVTRSAHAIYSEARGQRCSGPSMPVLASTCRSDERCRPVDLVPDNPEPACGAERPRVDIDLRYGLL
jgi:hypothetical protein